MTDIYKYLENLNQIDTHEAAFKSLSGRVTLREFRLLHEVSKKEGQRLSDISSIRHIRAQGVGRMCSSLKKRGLLSVKRDKRDKRARIVSLTKRGMVLESRCREKFEKVIANNK